MNRKEMNAELREFKRAVRAVRRTSAARRSLPPGSSRAKVTTANARWLSACEDRDRQLAALREAGLGALAQQVVKIVDAELELAGMVDAAVAGAARARDL